jgi:large subunit ribosomal protein L21
MEYAVIDSGGKQYKVKQGEVISIEGNHNDSSIAFDKVLLYVSDGNVSIGNPYLANVSVSAKVIGSGPSGKIRVSRFTAKSRHRRTVGFRPKMTQVQIDKIVAKEAKSASGAKEGAKKT